MRYTRERVARITRELKTLSTQFQWSAFEDSSQPEQARMLNDLLNGTLVEDLRATVDYLSRFLWSYIDSAVEESDREAGYMDLELRNVRLLRITEMLRLLHRSSFPFHDPLAFVDRVTKSVDRHLNAADDDLLCESRAVDSSRCAAVERPHQEKASIRGSRARAS